MRRASFVVIASAIALALTDCAQTPTSVPVRSLERSGKLALLCLDSDTTVQRTDVGYPLAQCVTNTAGKPGGSGLPTHVYALVNQTTRGEVAVLDVTYGTVLDVDPTTPGYNFLPVGQQPVDIVATPEGTAAFVATAEANRPAIYALPSSQMRTGGPTITAWPACTLPARPGAMQLVAGASTDESCGGANWANDTLDAKRAATPEGAAAIAREKTHPHGDLSGEVLHPGRQKLIVTLPTEGEILVIDAQRVLDRDAGSFEPCPIERKVKLVVDVPPNPTLGTETNAPVCPPLAASNPSPSCPVTNPIKATYPTSFEPMPNELAFEGSLAGPHDLKRLFISDERAPVIHVMDMADPCDPREQPPLLPSSFDDPGRPVTTSAIALSPITRDLKQYLYAVDEVLGSVMVFDVGKTADTRTPLVRPRPDFFPGSPRDRLAVGAPVRAIQFFTQELPYDDGSGDLRPGTSCDPSLANTDVSGGVYQTSSDYTTGAGPRKLRGVFALAALTSGSIVVVDVDDYDAPCRTTGPDLVLKGNSGRSGLLPDWITGCGEASTSGENICPVTPAQRTDGTYGSTAEYSCRVVDRHEVRSANFVAANAQVGSHAPSFVSFPVLAYKGGSLRTDQSQDGLPNPRMLGPNDANELVGGMGLYGFDKGGTVLEVPKEPYATASGTTGQVQNFVLPDIREPRTAVEQDWSLTYSGVLPGFDGKAARLDLHGDKPTLYDGNGYFCANGTHDLDAARIEARRLLKKGVGDSVDVYARALTDYVEITNALLDQADPYWSSPDLTCNFNSCRATFGTPDYPNDPRFFKITNAYQDHVELAPTAIKDSITGQDIDTQCCFPTLVSYRMRGGDGTWIAVGSSTGFLHHVLADNTGKCILAGVVPTTGEVCDETQQVRTGRAYQVLSNADTLMAGTDSPDPGLSYVVANDVGSRSHTDAFTFHNPQMYLAVYPGTQAPKRDMTFAWHMTGGFAPLGISVGRGSPLVAPQTMVYNPILGSSVLVTDGALQGVVLVDMYQLAVSNAFF